MINYQKNPGEPITAKHIKIVGIGGAGANMLEQVKKEGGEASSLLLMDSDIRILNQIDVKQKITLGGDTLRGLGAGGDASLGFKAANSAEQSIESMLNNSKIVFICVGLGKGLGTGGAPAVARIAKSVGAYVVVFATIPLSYEGSIIMKRAEDGLEELDTFTDILITFDNSKMGELVLKDKKNNAHDAYIAANSLIAQSIQSIIRMTVQPGIVSLGLDDLQQTLKNKKAHCLFGSGIAKGKERGNVALEKALSSPLLDKGSLLESSTTVLVHVCGSKDMSLSEVDALMKELVAYTPKESEVIFGLSVDEQMGEQLCVTIIGSLDKSAASDSFFEESEEVEAGFPFSSDQTPVTGGSFVVNNTQENNTVSDVVTEPTLTETEPVNLFADSPVEEPAPAFTEEETTQEAYSTDVQAEESLSNDDVSEQISTSITTTEENSADAAYRPPSERPRKRFGKNNNREARSFSSNNNPQIYKGMDLSKPAYLQDKED